MRVLSRILSAALTGLALTVTVSCSSGSDDSSGNLGAQFCEVFRPCCVKAGMNGSQSTCRSLYGSLPAGAAAEQCLKDYQEQAKDPAFCQFELPEPESCKSAFPDDGGKKPGESCSSSSDCGGDGTCDKDLDTGKGTCAAFVVVGEGAACVGERNGTSSSWSGDAVNHQITLCDYAAIRPSARPARPATTASTVPTARSRCARRSSRRGRLAAGSPTSATTRPTAWTPARPASRGAPTARPAT